MKLPKVIVLTAILSPLPIAGRADAVPYAGATVGHNSATALAVQCPDGRLACFGASGPGVAVTQPVALTPSVIAAAGTYQQAAPAGKATTGGGFIQPSAGNTGLICIDVSVGASTGLTTPTGGQICQIAAGSTAPITFPATSGAIYVYGTVKGDTFSGSAS